MRVLASLGLAACLTSCHGASSPTPLATPNTSPRATPSPAARPPRYFPRAPATLVRVGETEAGAVALHGSIRLLLRDGNALPDAAPQLIHTNQGSPDSAGVPTSNPASSAYAVPPRLGGGWLFVVGRELWHAPSWLAAPKRLFEFNTVPRVHLGLDAPVAQETGRAPFAFRVQDGARVPLERWPSSPAVVEIAARDAQHAAVVADLRGLSVTDDGGLTWKEVLTPRTPFGVRASPGGYQVRVRNGGDDREVGWQVDLHGEARGEVTEISGSSHNAEAGPSLGTAWERIVEHGQDDADRDRYVVLDHGVLERWRQSDGAWLGRTSLSDSRDSCQPVRWPNGRAVELGFACTGPHGTTLWRLEDGAEPRPIWQRKGARRVWSAEIGALAIEGACEEDAKDANESTTLCVWGRRDTPTTVRLQGSSADDRIAPLRDGTLVVLRPPSGPARARRGAEVFIDSPNGSGARVQGIPLRPSGTLKVDVAAHLAEGHWLTPLEALESGELATWIEHDGRLLGVRIGRDGRLELGPRSAVATTHRIAGARSLSWSKGGAGFESVDGGLHYTQIGLPQVAAVRGERKTPESNGPLGCSAIGCILPSLVRIGWGAAEANKDTGKPTTAPTSNTQPIGRLHLRDCSLVSRFAADAPIGTPRVHHQAIVPRRYGVGSSPSPFFATQPPKIRPDQTLQAWDSVDPSDRRTNTMLGRVFLWGAYAIGPDPDAGWQWRWFDARTHSVHASAIARPPDALSMAQQMQTSMLNRTSWSVVPGSDARHALGLAHDGNRSLVFALVEGEAPSPIELADGSDFGTLDSAVAAPGDRAILVGAVGDPAGTAVYLARGTRAERVARIPRVGVQGRPPAALALLHSDGTRVAVAVEDRDVVSRSDAAFYLREAYPDDGPVRRFALDSSGPERTLRVCKAGSQGFEGWTRLDLPTTFALGATSTSLTSPIRAKLRFLDDGDLCVLELSATLGVMDAPILSARIAPNSAANTIPVTLEYEQRHLTAACSSK